MGVIETIPTILEKMTARQIIDAFDEAYKSSEMIYEMMISNFINLSGIGFQTVPLKQDSTVFRARYRDNFEPIIDFADISYPPISAVKNFSRLNRPCQSLFYASESEIACILEMLPFWFDEFRTNDLINVTLSKWIVRYDLIVLIIPDTNNTNNFNKKVKENLDPEEIVFWDYISNKFTTTTKNDKNIYEFTAAFANALWLNAKRQNLNINGFIYGSVQSKQNVNIALSKDTIDSDKLTPVDFIELTFKRIGIDESGLPTYKEIGSRKKGIPIFDKKKIEWLE